MLPRLSAIGLEVMVAHPSPSVGRLLLGLWPEIKSNSEETYIATLCNLLSTLTALPDRESRTSNPNPTRTLTWPNFYGGSAVCKAVKYAQVLAPYLSSYTLVMTAVDRYQVSQIC